MAKTIFKRPKLWLIITGLITCSGLVIILTNDLDNDTPANSNIYLELTRSASKNCTIPKGYKVLPTSYNSPPTGNNNIYFVETWRSCDKMAHLTARAACAIESAAKTNPKWNVYVFFIDVIGFDDTVANLFGQLSELPNVRMRAMTLDELSENTPLHSWVLEKRYEKSQYLVSHVSDLCRLLILYKYAGTYMDTDIISLKPLERLGGNYATAQGDYEVVPGFMNFGSDEIGRSVIRKLIERFQFVWKPDNWTAQGPELVTAVMEKLCGTNYTASMTVERCNGFRAIPVSEVLAIDFYSRNLFFDVKYLKKGLNILENSTATHLWNAYNGAKIVSKSKNNLLNYLALQQCPTIYLEGGRFW